MECGVAMALWLEMILVAAREQRNVGSDGEVSVDEDKERRAGTSPSNQRTWCSSGHLADRHDRGMVLSRSWTRQPRLTFHSRRTFFFGDDVRLKRALVGQSTN